MRNYYDEVIPIDEILSGLKFHVLCISDLENKINSLSGYSYCDDSLGERLSGYPDDMVVSKLELFILALNSVGYKDVRKAIPDYDSADINYLEEERQKILTGIQETIDFIQGLINPRLILASIKKRKLIDFPEFVTDNKLKSMGRYLAKEDVRMINYDKSFADILRGKVTNKKIVWKSSQSHFNYFFTELFKKLGIKGSIWKIADVYFTYPDKAIKDVDMAKNNGKIPKNSEIQINTAISYLAI